LLSDMSFLTPLCFSSLFFFLPFFMTLPMLFPSLSPSVARGRLVTRYSSLSSVFFSRLCLAGPFFFPFRFFFFLSWKQIFFWKALLGAVFRKPVNSSRCLAATPIPSLPPTSPSSSQKMENFPVAPRDFSAHPSPAPLPLSPNFLLLGVELRAFFYLDAIFFAMACWTSDFENPCCPPPVFFFSSKGRFPFPCFSVLQFFLEGGGVVFAHPLFFFPLGPSAPPQKFVLPERRRQFRLRPVLELFLFLVPAGSFLFSLFFCASLFFGSPLFCN